MGRRIFVGIKASKTLQAEIINWRKNFLNVLSVRWIALENLHITLIPPWNEDDIVAVKQALNGLKNKVSSFEIVFNNVSFGPNPRRPRLIWAEGKDSGEMVYLKRTLEKVLGKREEKRILRPHITLARFRLKDFHSFKVKKLNENVVWREKINSFCLYASRTFPSGAKYKILEIVNFE